MREGPEKEGAIMSEPHNASPAGSIRTAAPPSSPQRPAPPDDPVVAGECAARLRRLFLRVLIVALSASALIGLAGVIAGFEGELFFRFLLTSISLSGYFTLAIAHAISLERRRPPLLPRAGLVVTAVCLAVVLLLIWFGEMWTDSQSEVNLVMEWVLGYDWLQSIVGTSIIIPIYLAVMTLMFLPRNPAGFANRARWTTVITGTIATIIMLGIVINDDWIRQLPFDDEYVFRALAACLIVGSCTLILVPVLLKFESINRTPNTFAGELKIRLICPRCGLDQIQPMGHTACPRCQLGFEIDVKEPACEGCGYPLFRLEDTECPECGTPVPDVYRRSLLAAKAAKAGAVETEQGAETPRQPARPAEPTHPPTAPSSHT